MTPPTNKDLMLLALFSVGVCGVIHTIFYMVGAMMGF